MLVAFWETRNFNPHLPRPDHLFKTIQFSSVQFSSVAQSCPTLCDPMNHRTPGLPVHHQLPEFTQTHVHQVSDAIEPSHPLSSPSAPAPNPSQHQSLFQWVNSSHQSCPTLSNPMDCSLPGSCIHGIFQARVLEWGAIAFYSIKSTINFKHIE